MDTKPFDGISFCCTGISSLVRDDVAKKVEALGGTHYSDLMSDVNFLIVGERDTAKYNYCIKRRFDVKFINADAIVRIHALWLKGEDDDSPKLSVLNYLKPVFDGVNACMSRIELELDSMRHLFPRNHFRARGIKTVTAASGSDVKIADFLSTESLTRLILENGGRCTESLTTSNTCVVSTEMQGRRYNKAVEWEITVVHPIYIFDCLLRGALLAQEDYKLTEESSYDNGCQVWDEIIEERITRVSKTKAPADDAPRKRTVNNPKIWDSIMDTTKSQTRKSVDSESVWEDKKKKDDSDSEEEVHFGRFSTNSTAVNPSTDTSSPHIKYLFSGFNFLIIGFNEHQTSLLTNVIETHSGEISSAEDDTETITTILLPAMNGAQSSMMLRSLPKAIKSRINSSDIKVYTEWFIERSIYYKKITNDRWALPIKGLIPSNKQFKICISGFTGIELLHIEKLVKFLNFEFCEALTSQRDLLIVNINLFKATLAKNSPQLFQYKYPDITACPTYQEGSTSSVSTISSKNKINAAKRWHIPIVSISYLWEILERSTGKSTLIMPDILELQWCLFAPSDFARPKSLLEYVKNLSGNHLGEGKRASEETEPSGSMRLPSPRKTSAKRQRYGRLTGREDSLKSVEQPNSTNSKEVEPNEEDFDVTNDEDAAQVRYQDAESLRNERELLKKLGSSSQDFGEVEGDNIFNFGNFNGVDKEQDAHETGIAERSSRGSRKSTKYTR